MIRHILKIMWNQRRSNGWIFAELAVVAAVLWMMIDTFWVDYRTYHAPLGFDIGNVWRFKLSDLDAKAPGYVPDSLYHSSDPEDLTRLMTQIRQNPEVEDVCVTFYSCPYSNGNFLMTFGFTYFLMGVMICIGVWFPVRKAVRLAPAEALRYE